MNQDVFRLSVGFRSALKDLSVTSVGITELPKLTNSVLNESDCCAVHWDWVCLFVEVVMWSGSEDLHSYSWIDLKSGKGECSDRCLGDRGHGIVCNSGLNLSFGSHLICAVFKCQGLNAQFKLRWWFERMMMDNAYRRSYSCEWLSASWLRFVEIVDCYW